MKFLHVVGLGLTTTLFAIISCSNGMQNYYSGGGTQCAKGYDPIPNDMTTTPGYSKVGDDKKIIFSTNNAGTYTFQGSDAMFSDSNGVVVHVNIRPDNNQISVVNRTCVDGLAQFDRQPDVHFSAYLPGLRSLTTDANGKVTTFKIENLGYIYTGKPGITALSAVNCNLSDDPSLPPIDPTDKTKTKPDPAKCGTLDPSTVTMVNDKVVSKTVTSINDLFPIAPGSSDKLTIYCIDIAAGSCADPLAAKNYQIRYYTNHRIGHTPSDGRTRTVEYGVTFTWTPNPPPAADVTQKSPM